MNLAIWVGPAIVAAVISASVTGMGWLVSERQAMRRAIARRRERRDDMQIALLAEIRASQHRIGGVRVDPAGEHSSWRDGPEHTPFVPRQIRPIIFDKLASEIHLLPADVIDPVVVYYQQAEAVSSLAEDMNTDRYRDMDQERKRMVYDDYTALLLHQDILARIAIDALSSSLNIQGAAVSAQRWDAAQDEAEERNS